MTELEFFFEYASPYSYFASERIEAFCERLELELVWRPIMLGGIFKQTGHEPPKADTAKGDYGLRDAERWAQHHDIPFHFPENFPVNALKAARGTLLYEKEPFLADYIHACYRAYWADGKDLMDDGVLSEIVSGLGQDPQAFLAAIEQPELKARLKEATERAHKRGVFGAPSFIYRNELFWGNDRMDFLEAFIRADRTHPAARPALGG